MAMNSSSNRGQNRLGSRLLHWAPSKKGTINAGDNELKELVVLFEEAATFGGVLVVLGVATEVALLIWPVENERLAAVLANIFVAIGVGIEVLCGVPAVFSAIPCWFGLEIAPILGICGIGRC